jgi:hypothetical protein
LTHPFQQLRDDLEREKYIYMVSSKKFLPELKAGGVAGRPGAPGA